MGNFSHSNAQIISEKLQKARATGIAFPKNKFGKQLETTAQIILSGLNVPVYKVELGSFDTHNKQTKHHTKLLTQLSEGLASFSSAMKKADLWDDVLIVTYSEFGRRVKETLIKSNKILLAYKASDPRHHFSEWLIPSEKL